MLLAMLSPAAEQVAVLVVRAWREDEGPADLRARITWVDDVGGGEERAAVASGTDEILGVVRRWLDGVAGGA